MRNLSDFNHLDGAPRAPRCAGILLGAALAFLAAGPPPPSRPPEPAGTPPLRWPLDPPRVLRSGFGEFREGGRVHGGLDLSTGGRTGLPVRALGDGEVFRLKLEWRGYGQAVYQRLAGGRVAVYAHLERLVLPGLEEVAREARSRAGRYPGDVTVEPPVPVRAGDVLALSGETGAGFPHVHFEVRTASNRPLDPLREGLEPPIADAEPPVFEAVWVQAARAGSWVEGAAWERRLGARRGGAGAWEAGPVRVAGAFDLAVEAHDPSPEGGRIGLPWIEARWDGRRIAASDARAFDFGEARRAAAIHDAALSHLSPTRFVYRPLAPRSSPWSDRDPVPALEGKPGSRHDLEIEARDGSGNRAVLRMSVEFVEEESLVRPVEAGAGGVPPAWSADPDAALWLDGALALPLEAPGVRRKEPPAWRILAGGSDRPLAFRAWAGAPAAGGRDALLVAALPTPREIRFEPAGPGSALRAAQRRMGGRAISVACGRATLRIPGHALPRGTAVTLQERTSPAPAPGLRAAGPALRIEPAWRVPAVPVRLRFAFDPHPDIPPRLGVYRWDAFKERWIHAGGTGEARSGSLEVALGDLGTFRLLEDVEPPQWGPLRPAPGERMEAGGWSVVAEVDDAGSGIHWDGVEILLDGAALESEYDPDRKRVMASIGLPLAAGTHRLRATARDRAGNEARPLEWTFSVGSGS